MTNSSSLAFAVGVTGHRDIPDAMVPLVKEHVSAQLHQIRQQFSSLPVEVISGLAEGADILVTEVALELGLRVKAVLPMPQALYEKDFSPKALAKFRALSENPDVSVVELPISNGQEADRDSQYLLLKDYLVRRSNVLMALWDGVDTGLPGGTSDVVFSYLCDGERSQVEKVTRSVTAADDGNLVIAITTPREFTSSSDGEVGFEYLMSEGAPGCVANLIEFPPMVLGRWLGFELFAKERFSETAVEVASYDLYSPEDAALSEEFEALNQEFVRADQLAISNQKNSDLLFRGFGLMAGMMGLAFLIYAKLAAWKIYLIVYLILFAAGYIAFRVSRQRAWFAKHLGYRALAETIRARYFLDLAGSGGKVSVEDRLRMMKVNRFSGLEWLYDAFRCAETLPHPHANSAGIVAVSQRWIDDQSAYFKKKVHLLHHEHERLETIKRLLFLGSFTGTLALLFFKKDLYYLKLAGFDGKTLLVFLMGLLPLWLALWELYQSKMAVRELAWQYSNQALLFSEAKRRLDVVGSDEAKLTIIEDLADNSLTEALQWTVHRFHREHEPPTAG